MDPFGSYQSGRNSPEELLRFLDDKSSQTQADPFYVYHGDNPATPTAEQYAERSKKAGISVGRSDAEQEQILRQRGFDGADLQSLLGDYRLGQARQQYKGTSPGGTLEQFKRNALPFGSLLDAKGDVAYSEAVKKFQAGDQSPDVIDTIARHERLQERDAEVGQSLRGSLLMAGQGALKMVGEGWAAGKVLSGVGSVVGGRAGRILSGTGREGALENAARAGSTRLGKGGTVLGANTDRASRFLAAAAPSISTQAARTAALLPLMPSMYVDDWRARNAEAGRDPHDPMGLPGPFLYGYANLLVLNRIQNRVLGPRAISKLGPVGTVAAAGGIGLGEQQAVDVAAGLWDEIAPEALDTKTRYGTLGMALRGEGSEALKHATVQAFTFSLFSGLHYQNPRKARYEAIKTMREFNARLSELRQKGLSEKAAALRASAELEEQSKRVLTEDEALSDGIRARAEAAKAGATPDSAELAGRQAYIESMKRVPPREQPKPEPEDIENLSPSQVGFRVFSQAKRDGKNDAQANQEAMIAQGQAMDRQSARTSAARATDNIDQLRQTQRGDLAETDRLNRVYDLSRPAPLVPVEPGAASDRSVTRMLPESADARRAAEATDNIDALRQTQRGEAVETARLDRVSQEKPATGPEASPEAQTPPESTIPQPEAPNAVEAKPGAIEAKPEPGQSGAVREGMKDRLESLVTDRSPADVGLARLQWEKLAADKKLTALEKETVERYVAGDTMAEIGKARGVTEEAVRRRLESVRKKLGVDKSFYESLKENVGITKADMQNEAKVSFGESAKVGPRSNLSAGDVASQSSGFDPGTGKVLPPAAKPKGAGAAREIHDKIKTLTDSFIKEAEKKKRDDAKLSSIAKEIEALQKEARETGADEFQFTKGSGDRSVTTDPYDQASAREETPRPAEKLPPAEDNRLKRLEDGAYISLGVSPEQAIEYKKSFRQAFGELGEDVKTLIDANTKGIRYYADARSLTEAVLQDAIAKAKLEGRLSHARDYESDLKSLATGTRSLDAACWFDGHLYLDGKTTAATYGGRYGSGPQGAAKKSIYLHELGHSLDGPRLGISSTPRFIRIFNKEINVASMGESAIQARLTEYARTNPAEGFAEVIRVVHELDAAGLERFAKEFPETADFLKNFGDRMAEDFPELAEDFGGATLWPSKPAADGAKSKGEVFTDRIELSDGQHLDMNSGDRSVTRDGPNALPAGGPERYRAYQKSRDLMEYERSDEERGSEADIRGLPGQSGSHYTEKALHAAERGRHWSAMHYHRTAAAKYKEGLEYARKHHPDSKEVAQAERIWGKLVQDHLEAAEFHRQAANARPFRPGQMPKDATVASRQAYEAARQAGPSLGELVQGLYLPWDNSSFGEYYVRSGDHLKAGEEHTQLANQIRDNIRVISRERPGNYEEAFAKWDQVARLHDEAARAQFEAAGPEVASAHAANASRKAQQEMEEWPAPRPHLKFGKPEVSEMHGRYGRTGEAIAAHTDMAENIRSTLEALKLELPEFHEQARKIWEPVAEAHEAAALAHERPGPGDRSATSGEILSTKTPRASDIPELVRRGANLKKVVSAYFRGWFKPEGKAPRSAFDLLLEKDATVSSQALAVGHAVADYTEAVGGDLTKRSAEQIELHNRALEDAAVMKTLPDAERIPLTRMRNEVDLLTQKLRDAGVFSDRLMPVIDANKGIYLTRHYEAHSNPAWEAKLRAKYPERVAAFKNWFNGEARRLGRDTLSDAELDNYVSTLLTNSSPSENPITNFNKVGMGKDLSILMPRGDLAKPLRDILGEVRDPVANYAATVGRQVQLLANHVFQTKLKTTGIEAGWLAEPDDFSKPGLVARLAPLESGTMDVLAGMKTTPEIKEALEKHYAKANDSQFMRGYMKVLGAFKYGKTVASPIAHLRQILGNPAFLTRQGYFLSKEANRMLREMIRGSDGGRNYHRELIEYGLDDNSVLGREFGAVVRDALKSSDTFDLSARLVTDRSPGKYLRKGLKKAQDLYRYEDMVFKVHAWENEKAILREAHPEATEAEVKKMAADKVLRLYPSYSQLSQAVKGLRRFPLVGPFVSFTAEVIRTTYNTGAVIRSELASGNPVLQKAGARRLVGMLGTLSAFAALGALTRVAAGVSIEEEDAIRRHMPPWSKDGQLFHLGKDIQGRHRVIDLGRTDPHSYLLEPFQAALSGRRSGTYTLADSLMPIANPFIQEELGTRVALDVARNRQETGGAGRPVYNPEDSRLRQGRDIALHFLKGASPGVVDQIIRTGSAASGIRNPRTGKEYTLSDELLADITGQREIIVDPSESLTFRARTYANRVADAVRPLNAEVSRQKREGLAPSADSIAPAYNRAEDLRSGVFDDLLEDVQAARMMGLSQAEVARSLKAAGLSAEDIGLVLGGKYRPRPKSDYLRRR